MRRRVSIATASPTSPAAAPPAHARPGSSYRSDVVRRQRRLLDRYHRRHDLRAREELVRLCEPLVRSLAVRHAQREQLDDLVQVGMIGLLKAIERFDPTRGVSFSSFAVPTISGELKRHLRDHTWAVRPPRRILEGALDCDSAIDRLSARNGRGPTIAEIADDLGVSEERVLDGLLARKAATSASLDRPVGEEADATLGELLPCHDRALGDADDRLSLGAAMATLPPRERRIVALRFGEDLTQQEIADRVGLSQMHVSRLLRTSLAQLRLALGGAEVAPST
jgi:RNA polymerase sigma-B factor